MTALLAARRWVFPPAPDLAAADRLGRELRLPSTLCRLLVQRGFAEPEDARGFLRPHAGQIHPPSALAGMGAAVERLVRARDARETVLVHGDYDVDGICATALYVRALRRWGSWPSPSSPTAWTTATTSPRPGWRPPAPPGPR
jgi:single-stranded-DNA-specific exonuclease